MIPVMNKGDSNERRGGLRRNRIVEPKLQPEDVLVKVGNQGKSVKLQSNFTQFSVLKTEKYQMYDTVFSSIALSPKAKLQVLTRLCQENKLPGAFCFDGRRLFTSENWHNESEIREFNLAEKKLTIRLLASILPETEEYYQMVNVLLNNLQVIMGQEKIGKGYFLSPNITRNDVAKDSGPTYFETSGFKVLGGFGTTLQRGTRSNGQLTTLLYIERINRVLNDNSVMSSYNRRNIDQLIGRDIITKYNNKTYRISDIKEMNINDLVEMGERKMSFSDYFKERYNITLQHAEQPFVLTRVKRQLRRDVPKELRPELEDRDMTISIPGELCFLCGFSDQEKSNIDLQKNLSGVLRRGPRDRLSDIPSFCDWIQQNRNAATMSDRWKLKIDNHPLEIEGRELPHLDVMSGGQRINEKIKDDWKFGKVAFAVPKGVQHEVDVVIVDRNNNNPQYSNFLADVEHEFKALRIDARLGKVLTSSPNDIEKALNDVERSRRSGCEKMALVFVPDDRTYARVKSFTMNTGLLTQCVTTRNGTNRNDKRRSVVSNKTVMQIFCKFGYDPWTVDLKMRPTMIVGMDTFHNKSSKKSIHASVFSANSMFTQYLSFANSPRGKQEFHDTLSRNFRVALESFRTKYNILPLRLIVFRDGVGDSQLQFTKQFEVDSLKPLIEKIYRDNGASGPPQLVYVIVKKRISTKLFNRGDNPNPGTVVDRTVVKPDFYEFFVVSQRVTKGTATPTNYNVLEDTRLLSKTGQLEPIEPNELQRITYALTHLYFNWMGTIRVPVPVHYAHRLAELVGKVHKGANPVQLNESIRNRLFYL